jgi:hypothetical protein
MLLMNGGGKSRGIEAMTPGGASEREGLSEREKTRMVGASERGNVPPEAGEQFGGVNASAEAGGPSESSERGFEFIDLTRQLEEICEVLGAAKGGVLVDAELRTSLGYENVKEWRGLVKRLEGEGLVRLFKADVNGRVKGCVQLRRGFHEAPEPQMVRIFWHPFRVDCVDFEISILYSRRYEFLVH